MLAPGFPKSMSGWFRWQVSLFIVLATLLGVGWFVLGRDGINALPSYAHGIWLVLIFPGYVAEGAINDVLRGGAQGPLYGAITVIAGAAFWTAIAVLSVNTLKGAVYLVKRRKNKSGTAAR
jgi:hypothetical protein